MNKINSPIHFTDTFIEFIGLEEPFRSPARVLLSLSPNPRILIDIENLPPKHLEYFIKAPISKKTIPVRLASGQKIEVFCSLKNGFLSQLQKPDGESLGITLLPARSPLDIQKDSEYVHTVNFKIINFLDFNSNQDALMVLEEGKWIEMTSEEMNRQNPVEKPCRALGRAILKASPWLVEITAIDELTKIKRTLEKNEGFNITHNGLIRQENEEPFSVEDVEYFLTVLSLFLSFARGCYTGIPIITGFNSNGKCVWKQCVNPKVDFWKANKYWFDPFLGDALKDVFPKFWDRFQNPKQGEVIRVALEWYLISNALIAIPAKIVLNQAALERLSFEIAGEKSGLKTGEWIAKAIDSTGIDLQIPVTFEALRNYQQENDFKNGPHTLVKIRNNLAHSKIDTQGFSSDIHWQASQLGLWYIELLLLNLFSYNGQYGNRLTKEWQGEVEFVPWAQNGDDSAREQITKCGLSRKHLDKPKIAKKGKRLSKYRKFTQLSSRSPSLDIDEIRRKARKAIRPLIPIESGCFGGTRTAAGRELPEYYLVYFLLVDLLDFKSLGRHEKIAWSIPVDLDGEVLFIEHRKLGLGVFSSGAHDAEKAADRVVRLIKKGVRIAKPYFDWRAERAVAKSKVNVRNKSIQLYERYKFLLDLYEAKRSELETAYENSSTGASLPSYQIYSQIQWMAISVIEGFFSWTEHVFIHLAILQGNCCTGEEVNELAASQWNTKFKRALDISDPKLKRYYDELGSIRKQVRNFVAHGAFGKDGEAFLFHSGAGAVPVLLSHRKSKQSYRFPTSLTLSSDGQSSSEVGAVALIKEFIDYIRSGTLAPAWIYLDSGENLILTKALSGEYRRAMISKEAMTEFTEYQSYISDMYANMEF